MLKNKFENKISWNTVYALAILALAAYYLLELIAPMRCQDLFEAYIFIGLGVLAGMYFSHYGLSGPAELKLYIYFMLWALLSRWLNRDIYLFVDKDLLIDILLAFVVFAAPFCLDKKQRERFIDVFTLIYGGFFLAASVMGIFVYLTNTYIHLPPENVWITIKQEGSLYSLNLLSSHRLSTAPRLFMAYMLFMYQLIKRRKVIARVFNTIIIVILHLAIALCHSRTTQIAMSGGAAMLAMLVLMPKLKNMKAGGRLISLCAAACAALVLCYFSFDLCNAVSTKAHNIAAPAFEQSYTALNGKPNEDFFGLRVETDDYIANQEAKKQQAESTVFPEETAAPQEESLTATDERKLAGNWTFTGRTEIWHAGVVSMLREPSKLAIGQLSKNCMQTVNSVLRELFPHVKEYKTHMHNSFAQVFMYMGVPGLLLALLWTLFLVRKMLRVFFNTSLPLEKKLATVSIAAFFVINLAEVFLFTSFDYSSFPFMIIAGCFLADYKEAFEK